MKSEVHTPSRDHNVMITNERNQMKPRSVQLVESRYEYEGSLSDGRLGLEIGGLKHITNFYTNPNRNSNALTLTLPL